jgi:hypothetical protein
MRRITNFGGIAASILLIVFGAAALVMGLAGHGTVSDSIKQEQIVGTPDMTPSAIRAEVAKAGLKNIDIPSGSVADAKIDSAGKARTFAQYMRIHALLATDGQVYAEMPRFLDKAGKPTADQSRAAIDPKSGSPVENPARNIWVNETALSTALNTSFFANQVALFSVIIGAALLLIGAGFGVVTIRVLLARKEPDATEPTRTRATAATA